MCLKKIGFKETIRFSHASSSWNPQNIHGFYLKTQSCPKKKPDQHFGAHHGKCASQADCGAGGFRMDGHRCGAGWKHPAEMCCISKPPDDRSSKDMI